MKNCIFGFILGVIVSFISICYTAPLNLVSIEYTEKCKCGSQIECYKSFADGYETKVCKGCGYHDAK